MSRFARFLGAVAECGLFGVAWLLTLAFLALPRFSCGKDRAYVTAMKSDLRNISTMFAAGDSLQHFRSSTGVTVTYSGATPESWRARATHQAIKGECIVDASGEPRCDVKLKSSRSDGWVLFSYTTDFWLFAFSLRRRRRRSALANAAN